MVGSEYQQVSDAKITSLGLKWDGPAPVELSINGPACALVAYLASAWTLPAGLDNETGSEAFLVPTGGTFQIETASDTPVTALVPAGEITISNDTENIPSSATILPGDISEKKQAFAITLSVVPENLDLWRKIITGTQHGTTAKESVVYGSFALTLVENAAGTGSLAFRGHKVAWDVGYPVVDPAGGYTQLDFAGVGFNDGTHCPFEAILTNAVHFYGVGQPGS